MAELVALADAVVAALNGAGLTPAFTAERSYRPRWRDEDFGSTLLSTQVRVVPLGATSEPGTRAEMQVDQEIGIGVYRKVGGPDQDAEIGELIGLCEAIHDVVKNAELELDDRSAIPISVDYDPPFEVSDLDQHGLFTGVVLVTYRRYT